MLQNGEFIAIMARSMTAGKADMVVEQQLRTTSDRSVRDNHIYVYLYYPHMLFFFLDFELILTALLRIIPLFSHF